MPKKNEKKTEPKKADGKKQLADWQQRVIYEKEQLDDRVKKLKAFVAKPPAEVHGDAIVNLKLQLHHMEAYSSILATRIATF